MNKLNVAESVNAQCGLHSLAVWGRCFWRGTGEEEGRDSRYAGYIQSSITKIYMEIITLK
jgi:hypothetical protein